MKPGDPAPTRSWAYHSSSTACSALTRCRPTSRSTCVSPVLFRVQTELWGVPARRRERVLHGQPRLGGRRQHRRRVGWSDRAGVRRERSHPDHRRHRPPSRSPLSGAPPARRGRGVLRGQPVLRAAIEQRQHPRDHGLHHRSGRRPREDRAPAVPHVDRCQRRGRRTEQHPRAPEHRSGHLRGADAAEPGGIAVSRRQPHPAAARRFDRLRAAVLRAP